MPALRRVAGQAQGRPARQSAPLGAATWPAPGASLPERCKVIPDVLDGKIHGLDRSCAFRHRTPDKSIRTELRGHRFVRYADDCNIYVRSDRSGQRVMASVEAFIRKRLRLQVNAKKSAVARPEDRHFLGFRLRREPEDGHVEVLLSSRSRERIDQQIRSLIARNWGGSIATCLHRLNGYLRGWIGFFGICTLGVEGDLGVLDAHIRRRLRALQLKQWKRRRTIVRKLVGLGCKPQFAWREIYAGRRSLWALSHNPAVDQTLRNAYWADRGLFSLRSHWRELNPSLVAPRSRKRSRATARS